MGLGHLAALKAAAPVGSRATLAGSSWHPSPYFVSLIGGRDGQAGLCTGRLGFLDAWDGHNVAADFLIASVR